MGQVRRVDRLTAEQARAVRTLADDVAALDGAPPLSDQTVLMLGHDGATHLLLGDDSRPTGYAQVGDGVAELLVGPDDDRATTADALLAAASGAGARLAWAHGEDSPVVAALQRRPAVVDRTLLQLRRPDSPVDAVPVPDGITVRPFVVGRDEDAWLAVNARAFAHHREQGGWTRDDLEDREHEDWFDADGFLLALDDRSGNLLGFHWTKLHGADADSGGRPVGEVYVIAVDPDAQGRGLSKVLLAAGLRHLRTRGASTTVLYTDGDNTGAIALYEKYGFVPARTDAQYRLTGA